MERKKKKRLKTRRVSLVMCQICHLMLAKIRPTRWFIARRKSEREREKESENKYWKEEKRSSLREKVRMLYNACENGSSARRSEPSHQPIISIGNQTRRLEQSKWREKSHSETSVRRRADRTSQREGPTGW